MNESEWVGVALIASSLLGLALSMKLYKGNWWNEPLARLARFHKMSPLRRTIYIWSVRLTCIFFMIFGVWLIITR